MIYCEHSYTDQQNEMIANLPFRGDRLIMPLPPVARCFVGDLGMELRICALHCLKE